MDSKIILISGASRGIGKQTAIELTKCGYTVIADYNKSEQSAKELQKEYNIDIFKADISNSSEIKKLTDYVLNKYKKIDVLINNAGNFPRISIAAFNQGYASMDYYRYLEFNDKYQFILLL